MRSIRCGKISVLGEPEEIAVSPRPRSRPRHGKGSNLYSTRGLDKFEDVYSELSARREYISNKTGAPEALVRFSYWEDGWVPVVVRAREGIWKKNIGGDAAGVTIPRPVENNKGEKDSELGRRDEGDDINGESESISISVLDERSHSPVVPAMSWSQFLKTRAFGILGLSAMWLRKSAVPGAAVMGNAGGGMCMKNFILNGVSYFAGFSRNPETSQNGGANEIIAEQKDVGKVTRRTPSLGLTVTVPSRPVRAHVEFSASPRAVKPNNIDPEHHHHHRHQSKAKIIRRVVAVDTRPTRSAGAMQRSYRRMRQAIAYDTSMSATVFIIMLFCLVFSGRLCAIFFTSAWWYLIPVLRKYERNQ